jgi:single-stranded-DNA-specific exonuclease
VLTENLPHLERELKRIALERLADMELVPTLVADVELPLSDVTPTILHLQSQIEPTGNGNREVRFVSRNLKVTQYKKIGKDQSHLRLTLTDGRITYDAVAFKQAEWADSMPGKIDILFSLEENVWMGKRSLQLNILDIQPSEVNQQSGT